MTTLLIIIYLSFISLGLPDSLLGSAWPSMYQSLGVPVSYAGIASMIVAGGTIVSSLCSERLIRRLRTPLVTLLSVSMTAVALLGISFAGSFPLLLVWAIPLGLGAGSVDAALNNFVALHYKAAHMNWLHCFWGIGASVGPIILSFTLATTGRWQDGYRAVSILQFALVGVLLLSLPLWKRAVSSEAAGEQVAAKPLGMGQVLALPGAKATLIAFFCYCGIENVVGLWGSTFLVTARNIPAETAAGWISLYYMGITVGRLGSGILSTRLSSLRMLCLGQALIGLGVVLLLSPLSGYALLAGLFSIGLGCAPIFPTLLHETPNSFGKENSQVIMGIQMATAYTGSTLLPPVFGFLGGRLGYGLLPICVAVLLGLMAFMVQSLYTSVQRSRVSA